MIEFEQDTTTKTQERQVFVALRSLDGHLISPDKSSPELFDFTISSENTPPSEAVTELLKTEYGLSAVVDNEQPNSPGYGTDVVGLMAHFKCVTDYSAVATRGHFKRDQVHQTYKDLSDSASETPVLEGMSIDEIELIKREKRILRVQADLFKQALALMADQKKR